MSIRMAPIVSHLELYLRAMADVSNSTHEFDTFPLRFGARSGLRSKETWYGLAYQLHVPQLLSRIITMTLAQSGSTEDFLAAFFYGREDIIPEMFSRLQKTLAGARNDNASPRHFIYYIERHIEARWR